MNIAAHIFLRIAGLLKSPISSPGISNHQIIFIIHNAITNDSENEIMKVAIGYFV